MISFLRLASWLLMIVGIAGAVLMLAPAFAQALPGHQSMSIISVLPAAGLMLLLGLGLGGVLRVLISIDDRLALTANSKGA